MRFHKTTRRFRLQIPPKLRRVFQFRLRIPRIRHKRRLLTIGALAILLSVVAVIVLRGYSALQAQGRIYALKDVPQRPVAIIFGAGIQRGSLSPILADRVKVGVKLYQEGKVKALLLTGDNHIKNYNEPEAMRDYAINQGVPPEAVVLDYAGFRTYDSCYRARDIFKVDKAILVTQDFHLDRALFICNSLGVDSVGVAADVMRPEGYSRSGLLYSNLRELPSTAFAMLDLLRGAKPTFLGDPLPIFKTTS